DAVETAPAPFLNSANTVLTPSPAGSVNEVLDANGTHAPKVLPSLEKRMSRTGSPMVGLDADRLSVTVVLLVNVAPELTEIVPDGTTVSRYRVYEPEPPLLFWTTRASKPAGLAPVFSVTKAGEPGAVLPEL